MLLAVAGRRAVIFEPTEGDTPGGDAAAATAGDDAGKTIDPATMTKADAKKQVIEAMIAQQADESSGSSGEDVLEEGAGTRLGAQAGDGKDGEGSDDENDAAAAAAIVSEKRVAGRLGEQCFSVQLQLLPNCRWRRRLGFESDAWSFHGRHDASLCYCK